MEKYYKFVSDFQKTVPKTPETTVYSPYSIFLALSMVYQGLKGKSAKELKPYFSTPPKRFLELNNLMQKRKKIKISEGIFFNLSKGGKLKKKYVEDMKKFFQAQIKMVNFNDNTLNDINKWIETNTNGLIKDFLKDMSDNAIIYLINCIYFEHNWDIPFPKSATKKKEFNIFGKKKIMIDTMINYDVSCRYSNTTLNSVGIKTCSIPYKNFDFSMLFVIPANNTQKDFELMEKEIFNVKNDFFNMKREHETLTQIEIPKFEVVEDMKLVENFKKMKMEAVFKFNKDFSKMIDHKNNIHISRILHKSLVKIDEKGTIAAAVTVVSCSDDEDECGDDIDFIVNQPFYAFIVYYDRIANERYPIFIIRFVEPQNKNK